VRSSIGALLILLSTSAAGAANDAAALLNGRDLARACRVLERGLAGKGNQIKIPNTKDAFLCWGYIQAIQDLVVLRRFQPSILLGASPFSWSISRYITT
jgi:hypothetical protein